MPETYRFLIMTTDPVHVGTGGMRLGRVDNTIVREPGTKLPKIPGTALHGAIRAYAARRYGKPQCAGQGSAEGRKHCGRPTCPICYTFGSIQGEAGSFSGVVSISDARILLFPVYSMVGPVWVTSSDVLKDSGFGDNHGVSDDKAKWNGLTDSNFLNLGWLMLEKEDNWTPPSELKNKLPEPVKNRMVLVSPKLFSQIVNSNLEVRTSVAINPETGAVEEGALFTYEAIPRATFLWFDVVVDDFRNKKPWGNSGIVWKAYKEEKNGKIIWHDNDKRGGPLYPDHTNTNKPQKDKKNKDIGWYSPIDVVKAGLEWAEHLGIGGMGTRGFGRIKSIQCLKIKESGVVDCEEENNESSHKS